VIVGVGYEVLPSRISLKQRRPSHANALLEEQKTKVSLSVDGVRGRAARDNGSCKPAKEKGRARAEGEREGGWAETKAERPLVCARW